MKSSKSSAKPALASLATVALAFTMLAPSTPARAAELRFSTTAPGSITTIGNTLGLSKQLGANGPGLEDSIGTFVTLENTADTTPQNAANPWFSGTTHDWHSNGSAAYLELRGGTEMQPVDILYAELLWGGGYKYGLEDVTASLDTPVTLRVGNASMAVTPDAATALTTAEIALSGFPVNYYLRSAEVTDFVRQHRGALYEVHGVPATQDEAINSLNAAGWTLVVVTRDDAQPLRNLTVFVGGAFVDEDTQQDYAVSGFCAPPTGEIHGRVALSAIEGDAELTGDQLLIAPAVDGAFVPLEGPNNPVTNFFCGQINDVDGLLDETGTFGDRNHDAIAGTTVSGGRQGWDVTSVELSSSESQLFADQRAAVLRTITTGDSFVPTMAAFQIDVNAPNLTTSTLVPSRDSVELDDVLTLTSTAHNTGAASATNLRFQLTLPPGLTLEAVTSDGAVGDVTGSAVNATALAAGIDEGTLATGATRTVVVRVRVTGAPSGGSFFLRPVWHFGYVTCAGSSETATETYSHSDSIVFIGPPEPDAGTNPGDDAGSNPGADAGNNPGDDAGSNPGPDAGGGDPGDGIDLGAEGEGEGAPEDCGCASSGTRSILDAAAWLGVLALLGLVGGRARRRR